MDHNYYSMGNGIIMNWIEILKANGFVWNEYTELYTKSMGFGRKITVDQFMKGLFTIKEDDKVLYDGFIKSKKEYIDIIEKL